MKTSEEYETEIARLQGICRQKDERIVEAEEERDKLKKENKRLNDKLIYMESKLVAAIHTIFN